MRPERFHRIRSVLDRRQPDLTVLMERVNKEHNLSAIARNCDAVGVLDLHAVVPDRGLRLHRDTSGGTAKWIDLHRHDSIAGALESLKHRGFQVVAAHLDDNAVDFRKVDYTVPTAVLVGAELFGVSDTAAEAADVTAVIPMVGMVRSLNVSVATSLFLFEALRQRQAKGMYDQPRIPQERYREILFRWAYPEHARRYREAGLDAPTLGPEGELPDDLYRG
ncbi:MAG: tRNA (guanosine(18)-2'-O)-methyltransferase TrmH [Gemmatimonadales bacterium]|nr:MAG: tRNA (guanosine(18)-2'-O)-methyltransferase TrmH [Gemmatimonadales bacterium]